MMAQALFDGQSEKLAKKAISMALAGDATALRLVLERLVPPVKHRTVQFQLPDIEGVDDLPEAASAIISAVTDGAITHVEGEALMRLLDGYQKTVETAEIEHRLQRLEAAFVEGR